jgi:hypothetical protein
VNKAGAYLGTFQLLQTWVGPLPYPQTLDLAGKSCQGQTL